MVAEHWRAYLRERPSILTALAIRHARGIVPGTLRPARHRLVPGMLILRLTHRCNVRCRPCGQWGANGARTRERTRCLGELTTREWTSFVAEASRYCAHLYLFGGEPFMRSDVLDVVRCAHAHHMVTGINTNGTLMRGREEDMVRSGLDYLIVSLDGPEDVHNAIRKSGTNAFRATTASLERCVEAKGASATRFPLIHVCMTLTEENQAHILETARIASGLGADAFSVQLGTFTTECLAAESGAAFLTEFGTVPAYWSGFVRQTDGMNPDLIAQEVAAAARLWGGSFGRYPPFPVDLSTYYHRPEIPVRPGHCRAPWRHLQVLPNGDIAFCEDFPDLVVGNILEGDALEAWNGPRAMAFRRRVRDRGPYPACGRCCSP